MCSSYSHLKLPNFTPNRAHMRNILAIFLYILEIEITNKDPDQSRLNVFSIDKHQFFENDGILMN